MKWPVYNITGSLFKRRIGFNYQKVVKVSASQVASEKVTNTVGTFLTDYSSSIKKVKKFYLYFLSTPSKSPKKSIFLPKNTSIKTSFK